MRKILSIFLLLMMVLPSAVAQDLDIAVRTDQQVYIAGEGVWLDGRVSGAALPRYIQILLTDRKGQPATKIKLLLTDDRFSGYCELPANLRSDYYFFDAYVSGRTVQTTLAPIMIINPVLPPVPCAITASAAAAPPLPPVVSLPLTLSKSDFATREAVRINLPAIENTAELMINIVRKDGLSEYADSVIRLNPRTSRHSAIGLRETEGQHFQVSVKGADGHPKQGVRVFAAIMGDQAKISTGLTNSNGELEGIFPLVYGDTKMVLSLAPGTDSTLRMELVETALPEQPVDFPCLQLNAAWKQDIESRLLQVKVSRSYDTHLKRRYLLDGADTTDFYGRPDAHYNLDDYTRFPDMKEILLEFVPEARVRNGEGAAPVIEILNAPTKGYFDTNGLVLLDGIPVRDMPQLLALNPLLLQSIDIVSRKYFLGSQALNGILQYKSYKSDLAGYNLPVQDIIYPFQGVQIPALPEFPQYSTNRASHFPDFRNLLYRQQIILSAATAPAGILFYTSDASGEYEVILSGNDAKGQPVSARTSFRVQ